MQSQYEDFLECGGCGAVHVVLDTRWLGARKILGMEQHALERVGEER